MLLSPKEPVYVQEPTIIIQPTELLCAPIVIHDEVWLVANCFVHPGVTIGRELTVGCSVIVKDVASWGVFAGNPAAL